MEIILYILAVPVFLLLMGLEYLAARRRNIDCYDMNDFANNLSCGLLEQVVNLPLKGLLIFSYYYIYQHYAYFHIDTKSPYSWLVLWIAADFLYYWFHRATHRNIFLWAGHAVHHQSTRYNFSVAVRQGILQTLTGWVVYLPLAFIGFPTGMFIIVTTLITFYQFWIHTTLISRMGWFEKFFNTPSHHLVHHGKNQLYIDKNYGGSLIIWDKLFGTFEKESEPAEYGTTEPLNSWNPFYANIKVIVDALYYAKFLNSAAPRILIFFKPPEWIVNALGKDKFQSYQRPVIQQPVHYSRAYVFINIMITVLFYSCYLLTYDNDHLAGALLGFFILVTLLQIAMVLKNGNVMKILELLRGILLFGVMYVLFNSYAYVLLLIVCIYGLWIIVGDYKDKRNSINS